MYSTYFWKFINSTYPEFIDYIARNNTDEIMSVDDDIHDIISSISNLKLARYLVEKLKISNTKLLLYIKDSIKSDDKLETLKILSNLNPKINEHVDKNVNNYIETYYIFPKIFDYLIKDKNLSLSSYLEYLDMVKEGNIDLVDHILDKIDTFIKTDPKLVYISIKHTLYVQTEDDKYYNVKVIYNRYKDLFNEKNLKHIKKIVDASYLRSKDKRLLNIFR